jgi:hypothetical protein
MANGQIVNVDPVALATDKGDVDAFERDMRMAFDYIERRHRQKISFQQLRQAFNFTGKRTDEVLRALRLMHAITMVSTAEFRFNHDMARAVRAEKAARQEDDPAVKVATNYRVERNIANLYETVAIREEEPMPKASSKPKPRKARGETRELITIAIEETPGQTASQIAKAIDEPLGTVAVMLTRLTKERSVYAKDKPFRYYSAKYPEHVSPSVDAPAVSSNDDDEEASIRKEAEALVAAAQEKAMADEFAKQAARKQRVREMAEQMARERGIDVKYLPESLQ